MGRIRIEAPLSFEVSDTVADGKRKSTNNQSHQRSQRPRYFPCSYKIATGVYDITRIEVCNGQLMVQIR
ncbi:MAG TPA: hypothetical protein DDZ51_17900 [Planctomycetaceae bacterium]|nr:hypothetical protein [Planctomycetaceae bacterium]